MREYKTIGPALAARVKLDEKVAQAGEALNKAKAERDDLDEQLAGLLRASGQDRAVANGLIASWTTALITKAEDWDLLRPYVSRTGNWQILYRRLNMKACEELLATRKGRKPLPGTSVSEITKIKITKATR